MSETWSIAGTEGAAVDAAQRPLAALQAEGAALEYRSLAADRLRWDVWLDDPRDGETLLPDLGQAMTLYLGGARQLSGIVTERRIRARGNRSRAAITVSGPWWWLTQISLSSQIEDQSGAAAERSQFVFQTGSPRAHLMALIARAIELGAPISAGPIASCFFVPRISLRNMPMSEAIAEVMRWLADGIVYFDYSGAGDPALCMQRREQAATVTITPGLAVVPAMDIQPRLDLELESVEVYSAARATVNNSRATVWAAETAGAQTSGLPRRQLNLISGPEIDTYLPNDFADSVEVSSAPLWLGFDLRPAVFERLHAGLQAADAGGFLVASPVVLPGSNQPFQAVDYAVLDRDGNPVAAAFGRYLTLGESRDWWEDAGIESIDATITATIASVENFGQLNDPPEPPLWWATIGGKEAEVIATSGWDKWWWATISVRATLVKVSWNAETLIRPEDYAFVQPPAGLAANLLATQNWLPWEGELEVVVAPQSGDGHPMGMALNIAGFRGETANMRALISGYSLRLSTEVAGYRIGAPSRFAYRDLVNRFRASGNDNIYYLGSEAGGELPDPDPDPESVVFPDWTLTLDGAAVVDSGAILVASPVIPEGTIVFSGGELLSGGDFVAYNQTGLLAFAGDDLNFGGEPIAYNPN